jgi:hypothetical protein
MENPVSLAAPHNFIRFLVRNAFMKCVIAHHDRGGAAACQAFDKFDGVLAIFRALRAMHVGIQAKAFAEVLVQFVRTTQGAT